MFRWLKDKKRSRKGREKKRSDDDYGFRKDEKNVTSDYGFNERRYVPNGRTSVTDSPYHIYEEILELPDLPLTTEFARLNLRASENVNSSRPQTNRRLFSRAHMEGPYMVVPIAEPNQIPCEGSQNCTCGASDRRFSDSLFIPEETSEAPLCACMHRSNSEGRFTCTCREKPRTSDYVDPWDSSDNSGNSLINALSDNDLVRLRLLRLHSKQRDEDERAQISHARRGHHSSMESLESRNRSEPETEDTGCEYDMSTSSESEVTEYRSHLEKVEQNLILKEQVRNIIKSLSNESDNTGSDVNSNTVDGTDKASTPTVSGSGRSSSARTLSCSDASDTEVFADRSESDDSSGYYDCAEDKTDTSKNSECYTSTSGTSGEIKSRIKDSASENSDLQELVLLPTRISKSRSKRGIVKHRPRKCPSVRSENIISKIAEDTEMYLLPTNRRQSECSDVRVYKKPVLPFQNTPIYHDPYRAKTGGSSNRLLTDLIRMNYDKQHMVI